MPFTINSTHIENDELSMTEDANGNLVLEHKTTGQTVTLDGTAVNAGAFDAGEISIGKYQQAADYVIYNRDGSVRGLNQATESEEFSGSFSGVLGDIFTAKSDASVRIRSGEYTVSQTTTVPERATIIGDGAGTRLTTSSNISIFDVSDSNHVDIKQLTFIGNRAGESAIVATQNPKFLNLHGLFVHGFVGWGIDLREGWVMSLVDCIVRSCGDDTVDPSGTPDQTNGGGIRLSNDTAGSMGESNATTCLNVYAQNNYNIGVRLGHGGTKRYVGGAIEGNYGHGLVLPDSNSNRNKIESVWFELNHYNENYTDIYDVYLRGYYTRFENCTFHGTRTTNSVYTSGSTTRNNSFVNCFFYGAGISLTDRDKNLTFQSCSNIPGQIVETGTRLENIHFRENSGGSPYEFQQTTDSNGQVTVDLTPYNSSAKPELSVSLEGAYLWHVASWAQDSDGRYARATLQVTDTDGVAVGSGISVLTVASPTGSP